MGADPEQRVCRSGSRRFLRRSAGAALQWHPDAECAERQCVGTGERSGFGAQRWRIRSCCGSTSCASPADLPDDGAEPDFARRFFSAALSHGVLLRPIGNTVYFMPPYIVDEAEIDQLMRGARAALDKALA